MENMHTYLEFKRSRNDLWILWSFIVILATIVCSNTFTFSTQAANAVAGVVLAGALMTAVVWTAAICFKRWTSFISRSLIVLVTVPSLAISTVAILIAGVGIFDALLTDRKVVWISAGQTNIVGYLSGGGATESPSVDVRREREIFPGILYVRYLALHVPGTSVEFNPVGTEYLDMHFLWNGSPHGKPVRVRRY